MSLHTEPHFKVTSKELAEWLERQGVDRWWTVDGDPLLTGRLSFPCPGDELAAELRRLNRMLLVQDRTKSSSGRGEQVAAPDLNALVARMGDNIAVNGPRPSWANDRLLFLCWEDRRDDWLLAEDVETTERSRQDTAVARGTP